MGLLRAGIGALSGALADQWRDYFYAEALDAHVLAVKAVKRMNRRFGGSRYTADNVISNGSIVAVNEGQCMLIVDQGKVVEVSAEPGEFVYDTSTEPSIFYGDLNKNSILAALGGAADRFAFGGQAPKDQRVYFINTKELIGNKYGTASPVPFRVVDRNIGLDVDIAIKCFGEYSYRVVNPVLFYANVCGNVAEAYTRDQLDGQLKTELLTALQPAFARISEMGVRYSALPGHAAELARALNEALSGKWSDLRGIAIVSFGVSSVKASEEDEAMIKELQRNAAFRNPTMAAAHLVGSQAQAMQDAARNQGGAMMGFMGLNAAAGAGGANAQTLFNLGAQQPAAPAQPVAPAQPAADSWACGCGHSNTGKFCTSCGAQKPAEGWACAACGAINRGKFCGACGAKKPEGAKLYRCDKCGWQPDDPAHPPRFCPECGDPFDESDAK
ncbi:MAG: SPFH domain-containing protein [Clostridiales bacterium]|nr:SPFH domain-containing protein [Clostridiales bacterium]